MTPPRIAVVTGANQGLGRAIVDGLAPHVDRVLLTGRDAERVQAAAAEAGVEGRILDVRDGAAIEALADELGEVDLVVSNATARMTPEDDPADMVDAVAETNNLATTRVLRAFGPRLRPGGRLLVIASALGTLDKLDEGVRSRFAATAEQDLDAVDALTQEWQGDPKPFGAWLNIPSKVLQVAAVRAYVRTHPDADCLVAAICPGLIDTDASRPWFEDMSEAQTPAEAAAYPIELLLSERFDPAFSGELVQFGKVLPWETGIPVPHRAAT